MKFSRYLIHSLLLLAVVVLGCLAILTAWDSSLDARRAVWVGVAISYANTLIGFAIINWGFRQSQQVFFASLYGGIIFRFLLIFVLLFILIGALNMNRVALVASLVATYFLFLGLEIFQIHKFSDMERGQK